MSYAASASLQQAVFGALSGDADLHTMVSGAIFDSAPGGTPPATFVALGPEEVTDASDGTAAGSVHLFRVTVATSMTGFFPVKEIAARVSDILVDADLTLERGTLVSLNFQKAQARRVTTDDTRRIDLFFRARVADITSTV